MTHKPLLASRPLVSIVFVLDGPDMNFLVYLFRNLREQTYKNVEYVLVYANDFNIEEFKTRIYQETDIDLSTRVILVEAPKNHGMIDEGIKHTTGDVIFLKYCQPVIWHKGHIRAHLQRHEAKQYKKSFLLSFIEMKAIEMHPANPYGTVNYRITKKVDPGSIMVDEISFTKDVHLSFASAVAWIDKDRKIYTLQQDDIPEILISQGINPVFDPSKLLLQISSQIGNVDFCEEISVVALVPSQPRPQANQILTQPNWPNDQTLQVVDEDLSIRHCIPTIFGNTQLDEKWNNKMREYYYQYKEEIKTRKDARIIVKRMIGMGDVIETTPFIRFLKEEFPNAELWYVTSNSRSCKDIVEYFTIKPDKIIAEEQYILTDLLGYENLPAMLEKHGYDKDTIFDLRIDLDCAYESRKRTMFPKAYFDVLGETTHLLNPELTIEHDLAIGPQHLSVNLLGSGWPGKELNPTDVEKILKLLKTKFNGRLIHVSPLSPQYEHLKDYFDIVVGDDFEMMLQLTTTAEGFIGSDSGPLHLAVSQNIPCLVWNGSALTELTTPFDTENYPLTIIKHEELKCLGCKHDQFTNLVQISESQYSISFLPVCNNSDQYACMKDFNDEYLEKKVDEFLENMRINVVFEHAGGNVERM